MTQWGLVVLDYGSALDEADLLRYYTDIRRGRAPTDAELDSLKTRYQAIGGMDGLRQATERQAAALHAAVDALGRPMPMAIGHKHSPPFIEEAVGSVLSQGATGVAAVVMAPHFSRSSVGQYLDRVTAAAAEHGATVVGIERWWDLASFVAFHAHAITDANAGNADDSLHLVFTAHSLPESALVDDPYEGELTAGAERIAAAAQQLRPGTVTWSIAWQSAPPQARGWKRPDIADHLRDVATQGHRRVAICPHGFTATHLEVRWDLDTVARATADEFGLVLMRTATLDADPATMHELALRIAEAAR